MCVLPAQVGEVTLPFKFRRRANCWKTVVQWQCGTNAVTESQAAFSLPPQSLLDPQMPSAICNVKRGGPTTGLTSWANFARLSRSLEELSPTQCQDSQSCHVLVLSLKGNMMKHKSELRFQAVIGLIELPQRSYDPKQSQSLLGCHDRHGTPCPLWRSSKAGEGSEIRHGTHRHLDEAMWCVDRARECRECGVLQLQKCLGSNHIHGKFCGWFFGVLWSYLIRSYCWVLSHDHSFTWPFMTIHDHQTLDHDVQALLSHHGPRNSGHQDASSWLGLLGPTCLHSHHVLRDAYAGRHWISQSSQNSFCQSKLSSFGRGFAFGQVLQRKLCGWIHAESLNPVMP